MEEKSEEKEYITILIFKSKEHSMNGFGSAFNIIIPEGYGVNLFRRLVYSGCKAIGHREFLSLKLEIG